MDITKMLFISERQRQDKCKIQKQKPNLSIRIGNNKLLEITCLLGSNRIVNVCTRKGSKTG
jgi:predicted glycosyltransferase